jgi:hypothetical protein
MFPAPLCHLSSNQLLPLSRSRVHRCLLLLFLKEILAIPVLLVPPPPHIQARTHARRIRGNVRL